MQVDATQSQLVLYLVEHCVFYKLLLSHVLVFGEKLQKNPHISSKNKEKNIPDVVTGPVVISASVVTAVNDNFTVQYITNNLQNKH